MTKTAICTISSYSHIFKAKVLLSSARKYVDTDLFCLVVDGTDETISSYSGETYHSLSVLDTDLAKKIRQKYNSDKLRWACKPLYLMYLLTVGYERVIYVDNDIYFCSAPGFLFDELEQASVLLTPHYYSPSPEKNQNWFEANFWIGLYNAGFVGVSLKGMDVMEWWAKCCLYNIKKSSFRGLYDDQKYLDLAPILFEGVKVLRHKGCNVAGWNIEICPREMQEAGVYVERRYPVVFVHFTPLTFENILQGKDPAMESIMNDYVNQLRSHNFNYEIEKSCKQRDYVMYIRYLIWRLIRFFE